MNGTNTKRKIFIGNTTEASVLDYLFELLLLWEPANAFDEILISLPLAGQNVTHRWYARKGILIIKPLHL